MHCMLGCDIVSTLNSRLAAMTAIVGIHSEQSYNCHAAKHDRRKSQPMQLIEVSLSVQLQSAFWRRVLMPSKECAFKIPPM